MKRFLIALALLFIPALAQAQCNGVFPNNTLCGNVSGANQLPRPVPNNVLTGVPGGINPQIQFNNNGVFGGLTDAQVEARVYPLLPNFTPIAPGLTPLSGGGTTNFLRADGTFAAPPQPTLPNVNIATIASLRALSGAPAIAVPQVYVQGYYTQNDGGQGTFYYVASDTTSSDNGGTIIVDASAHRWYRALTIATEITLDQFGCKGDGVTNNAACMAATMTYLGGLNGGILKVPGKNYVTGSTTLVTSGIKIRGQGATMASGPTSIWTYTGTGSTFANSNPAVTTSGNEISDVAVFAQANTSNIIDMTNWSFADIRRNWLLGNSGASNVAIFLTGILGNYNTISGNYIGFVSSGITDTGMQNSNYIGPSNRIQPNASGSCIITQGTTPNFPNHLSIVGNICETGATAITGLNINNNSQGIYAATNRLELAGAGSQGIFVSSSATQITLMGNYYDVVGTTLADSSHIAAGIDAGIGNAGAAALTCLGASGSFASIKGIVTHC